ncbi:MAG: acyltransferase family protein [Solirubrobacterales bacterium]|nr:acyltransferase family protein [Solirubrobacterales bacterium]
MDAWGHIHYRRPARRAPAHGSLRSSREPASPYSPELPYAPGLDGVRAIAVAAVLFYHARVSWLPGGFLGVDVFFVLSGYLITSLLLAQYRRIGHIDLGRFWLGRARRLLPAAILVIAVCVVIGMVFLRSDLGKVRSDALASLFYVNNWHQILASHSYFAAFSRPSLLQHYWSLSVEEQFYLVWPLVLAGGLAISRRAWVVWGTLVAAAVSITLMALLYHTGTDPSRVYYGTDTRAAPLMIGAIMAFGWPLGRMRARVGRAAPALLDGVGIGALIALVLVMHSWRDFDPFLYHGGFLIVALLAATLVAVAVHPASTLGVVLGGRAMRWIGQRSYGIYLWHWPVMALTRPGIDLTWSSWIVVPMQIAITLVLAALSFRYVEMPVRRGQAWRALRAWLDRIRPRQRLTAGVAIAAAGSGLIATVALLPATSPRSPLASLASASAAATAVGHEPPNRPVAPVALTRRGPRVSSAAVHSSRIVGGVLAVGSSVMLASEPALQRRLHARVDAVVGRFNAAIIDRLRLYRDAGTLPRNVIVQLGDNDPVFSSTIVRLRAALRGVPHVVLVNIREPQESWEGEVNAALVRAARSWPQAIVADWRSASADPALLWDGVHPNPAGQAVYASVVAQALHALAARSAPKGLEATIVGDSVAETIEEFPQAEQALSTGLDLNLELQICRRLIITSCTYQGNTPPPALQAIKSLARSLGPLLVMDVGYDDDSVGYGSGIDQVMRTALAQGAREVIWLTLREYGNYSSAYQQTNAAIRQAARRWPQLRIADWNRYSAGQPWFADDVHPNGPGAIALAEFLRRQITSSAQGP